MDTLREKTAVITGAASGIGRAIARSLARQGAHIVAVDVDNAGIDALAGELEGRGAMVLPQGADVAHPEAFEVNTASFAGLFTYSYDRLPYAAIKAAIVQISQGLATHPHVVEELRRRVEDWYAHIDYQISREPE